MESIKSKNKLVDCLNMFWICLCIGAQMFGSGMAVVPILKKEFIEKRNYITDEELLDIMSIAKCTPGAYTVNIVTFIGNKKSGMFGGLAAATGVTIVPIIAIILFTMIYKSISQMEAIKSALVGITVCVCALIINSLIDLWKKAIVSKFTLIIFIISFFIYVFTDVSIIIIILTMGLSNFVFEKSILPLLRNKS